MAKDKKESGEDLAARIERAADADGMVAVKALRNVKDNGKRYDAGAVFHMHRDLVPSHVATGQVEVVGTGSGAREGAAV